MFNAFARPLALAAAYALAVSLAPSLASAQAMPALPAGAAQVSDARLAQLRGKYVAPVNPALRALLQSSQPVTSAASSLSIAGGAARSPMAALADRPLSGPVTYFGVTMQSSWTVGSGATAQGVSAGVSFGLAPSGQPIPNITIVTSSENGGLPQSGSSGNSVIGSPLSSFNGGVGQNIQIAGNGNSVQNTAVVTIDGSGLPPAATSGAQNCPTATCTAGIIGNGIGIQIQSAQGTATQMLGPGGIVQSAQVWTDMNAVINSLGVNVNLGSSSPFNPASLMPILHTINGLP